MQKLLSQFLFRLGTLTSCLMMIFNTGCVSGGWELTRDYSYWINSKKVGLRVVLYLLTSIVFIVTMFIDVIINNTMDFWQGKVSESTHAYHKDGKTFYVQHEILPSSQLKRSTIQIQDDHNKILQTIVLAETPNNEIDLIIDGVLRTRVQNIDEAFPLLTSFDKTGKMIDQKNIFIEDRVVAR